jgi:putative flippase GtrA
MLKKFIIRILNFGMKKLKDSNFIKYVLTGIIAMFIATAFMWFFVDVIGFKAYATSIIISIFIFFFKFFFHKNVITIFNKDKNNFMKYTLITFILIALNSFLLWIFVDTLRWKVLVMNPIITFLIFFLRYYIFHIFNMLKKA